ncbi:hypothetical protein AAA294_07440 [Fusobacterium varium]|uniref:hypothetical protein n=1 Tax=Fusobacterium varium TaxID=856 RepID=UPI0032C001F0
MFIGYISKGPDAEEVKILVKKLSFFKDYIQLKCDSGPDIKLQEGDFILGGYSRIDKVSVGEKEYFAETDYQELRRVLKNHE